MKLVDFRGDDQHRKNKDAIQRMCAYMGIEYITCNWAEQIPGDTDVVFSSATAIPPHYVPRNTKIMMGPQFFSVPDPKHSVYYYEYRQHNGISPKAVFNLLSPWVVEYSNELVKGPRIDLVTCPFPVDTKKFAPDPETQKDKDIDIMVYWKYRDPFLKDAVTMFLNDAGFRYKLITYGSYKEEEYIKTLHKTKMAIWIGCHESQGFALQECLSCNVPILILDVNSLFDECDPDGKTRHDDLRGKCNALATSAPYWDDRCGIKTKDLVDIPKLLEYMLDNLHTYKPREYVLEQLTEEVCWRRWEKALKLEPITPPTNPT